MITSDKQNSCHSLVFSQYSNHSFGGQYGQRHHQREMWEKLEEKAAITVKMAAHDIEWVKTGKEIRLQGHLFDVLSVTELTNVYVLVKGLFDTQEEQLVQLMQQKAGSTNSKDTARLIQFLKIACANAFTQKTQSIQSCIDQTLWWIPNSVSISSFKAEVLAPPPQAA